MCRSSGLSFKSRKKPDPQEEIVSRPVTEYTPFFLSQVATYRHAGRCLQAAPSPGLAAVRLIEDHFEEFATVYDERFARRWGYWRPVVAQVVEKYVACGILEHGFARVRCGSCKHEFLLAFSCKCRYFCPTCHAKRLALWGIWLEDTLLAAVPHRQVVLTVPKRLRPYFLYHRFLLGDLSRVAARTVTAFIRATVGERDLSVGIVSSIQTHGSLANWHPHLHMLVTDGGFRPDGTFVRLPLHDVATLTEALRRPFRRKARSPQVRTMAFSAQPPDLHRLSLGRESFAASCPLALLDCASYPVPVRRLADSLPASFSGPLTVAALRFAWVATTNSPGDSHPLVIVHAGHTE